MRTLALVFGLVLLALPASAQDMPIISGAAGFFTSTDGGKTTYIPAISPLLAAPIGKYVLVESRANLYEFFTPKANGQSGFDTSNFIALSYLSLDIIASRHVTFVAGSYLIPFGTYNERLSPIWISNFQDGPLI